MDEVEDFFARNIDEIELIMLFNARGLEDLEDMMHDMAMRDMGFSRITFPELFKTP
jgi:predicted DNA-binding protein (UPF0251 family)